MPIKAPTLLFIGCIIKSQDFRDRLDTRHLTVPQHRVDAIVALLREYQISSVLDAGHELAVANAVANVSTNGHMGALRTAWAMPDAALTLFWAAIAVDLPLRQAIENLPALDIETQLRSFKVHTLLTGSPSVEDLAANLFALRASGATQAMIDVWVALQATGPGIC